MTRKSIELKYSIPVLQLCIEYSKSIISPFMLSLLRFGARGIRIKVNPTSVPRNRENFKVLPGHCYTVRPVLPPTKSSTSRELALRQRRRALSGVLCIHALSRTNFSKSGATYKTYINGSRWPHFLFLKTHSKEIRINSTMPPVTQYGSSDDYCCVCEVNGQIVNGYCSLCGLRA